MAETRFYEEVGTNTSAAEVKAELEKEEEKAKEIKFLDMDIRVFLQARGLKVTHAVIDLINRECYSTIMFAIERCRDNKRVTLMPHDF